MPKQVFIEPPRFGERHGVVNKDVTMDKATFMRICEETWDRSEKNKTGSVVVIATRDGHLADRSSITNECTVATYAIVIDQLLGDLGQYEAGAPAIIAKLALKPCADGAIRAIKNLRQEIGLSEGDANPEIGEASKS